ncbi:hypothetical protein GCM10010168_86880 [Actinoplanes ianthinogenes]|uniref:Integrase n=1 Tax=Actinoplanes ianthinogenes TaxID=122358 RepID=A0ABN6CAZ4_9ACTN|nr:hypothetical protein [Actinoplanes ianthinogenes]BCJ42313.1 hypothetical protein Aiant_29700 [Actinoplanes ianthinogenes]GGR54545.1 hypothetical protein GCM10010168_86880 [Actinoplanes ianthinogenes]
MTSAAGYANVLRLRPPSEDENSKVVADDTDVRALIPLGYDIDRPVYFMHDRWDTAGHPSWTSKHGSQTALDFSGVPVHWRTAAKEWILLQLDPDLAPRWSPQDPIAVSWPTIQEPTKLVTAQGNLKQLRLVLAVLDAHHIITPTSEDWARVRVLMQQPQNRAEKLSGAQLAAGTLRGRAQQMQSLWSIRSIVGRPNLLGSEPFDGEETTSLFGSGHRPKRNLRRPHEDVGRCLGFVAWAFDHIADDILAHSRWWAEHTVAPEDGPTTQQEGYDAMFDVAREVHSRVGKLPGRRNSTGGLTLAHIALGLLCGAPDADEAFLWGRYAMRRFRDEDLDEGGGNPCNLPVTEFLQRGGTGNSAWTHRLLPVRDELRFWQSALVYYAMYYLAATCGLRDKDLACLTPGCVKRETKTRPNGETYEVVTMRGYKTKNRMAPQRTTWKVNHRIARIIEVIEELHRIHGITPATSTITGEPLLFDAQLITASARTVRDTIHLDLSFMDWLIKGAKRLHHRGVSPADLADVTRVNISQIRITAIQAYASRDLGNALAAQFGQWNHQSVAMGYHADVYKIIHLADPLDALELQHEHIGRVMRRAAQNPDALRGKGVTRMRQAVERQGPALSNPAPLSSARLKVVGKRNPNIAVGPYTICVHAAEGALCGGEGAADFRLCRPFECRNSAMTPGQRARVELRRRLELRMHPALHRSARKIGEAMPEIVAEFAEVSDDELARIIATELDEYVAEALGLAE